MRIAFVTPYVPSRIRVRPYYWLKGLAGRGHDITLFTVVAGEADRHALAGVEPFCRQIVSAPLTRWRTVRNLLRAIPGRTPLQVAHSWTPGLARLIEAELAVRPCDVVHVEHLRGAVFADVLRGRPIVYDAVDSIALLFDHARREAPGVVMRLASAFDAGRTRAFEGDLARRFSRILTASPADADFLTALARERGNPAAVTVIPNPVDLEYFSPAPGQTREPDTVLFSGKMSYHANTAAALDLVREVMPRVWSARADVRVWIVGQDPPREVRRLADDRRVTVTGRVPDLRPFLQKATLAVCPQRYGTGIQNKVLEAMACATPVVAASSVTTALHAQAGSALRIADTRDGFADEVLALLASPADRETLGLRGREYVEAHHDPAALVERLEAVYIAAHRDRGNV